jgi:hypothetical protein
MRAPNMHVDIKHIFAVDDFVSPSTTLLSSIRIPSPIRPSPAAPSPTSTA